MAKQSAGVAVIATGGKQYLVHPGDTVTTERLADEPEATVTLPDILAGKQVTATVMAHRQAPKVSGRIFHNKVRARRYPKGHRQHQTILRIDAIA